VISTTQAGDVAGVVLAAGGSTRMPGPSKLLRPWRRGILVESAISAAREAGLRPCVVVVGSEAEALVPCLARHDVILLEHESWRRGRASSLAAGLERLAESEAVRAVVVLLGDEPGVTIHAVRSVVEAWRRESADFVRVRYRDRPGHPVLLGAAARELAMEFEGKESVWNRLTTTGLVGAEVAVDLMAPIDVDVPSALKEARAREEAACSRPGISGTRE